MIYLITRNFSYGWKIVYATLNKELANRKLNRIRVKFPENRLEYKIKEIPLNKEGNYF